MWKSYVISFLLLSISTLMGAQIVRDSTAIRLSSANEVADLLRGQVSGVRVSGTDGNPFGLLNVNIRGVNSLRSDNQPLWIVDGVAVSTDINHNLDAFWQYGEESYTAPVNPLAFLDPMEIKSIQVLKNISATALYGSRGANGVIIVTTRRDRRADSGISWSSNVGVNYDNIRSAPSVSHKHRAAFSGMGKGGTTTYNISATFRDETGTLTGNRQKYGSIKANYETVANSLVHFGFDALASVGRTSAPLGSVYLGRPSLTLALRDPALSPGVSVKGWVSDYDDYADDYRALASAWLRFNLSKTLSLTINGGLDYQNNDRFIWYGRQTDFGAINEGNVRGGAAGILESSLLQYSVQPKLEYKRFFSDAHLVKAFISGELMGNRNRFNTLNGRDFPVHTMRAKGLTTRGTVAENHLFDLDYFHIGGAVCFQYDWKQTTGVTASFRVDSTPKYRKEGTVFYPAVEAYVDIRSLLFPTSQAVSGLRVTAGYGIAGRETPLPYEKLANYYSGTLPAVKPYTECFYDGLVRLNTREWTATLSTAFLEDRIKSTIGIYSRLTDDTLSVFNSAGNPVSHNEKLYYHRVTPQKVFQEGSKIANQGVEVHFDILFVRSKDWEGALNVGGAYNMNRIVASSAADYYGKCVGNNIYCTINAANHPVGSLFGYRANAAGKYEDVTGEGFVSVSDRVILGNTIPPYNAYLNACVRYKRLIFSCMIDGAAGFQIANINRLPLDGNTDSAGARSLSSIYVENGDFIRLSNIGLTWSVPHRLKWIRDIHVRLAAKNLLVITRYGGWNPDVNSFGVSALSYGVDYGSYPLTSSIIAGFTVNF